MKIYFLWLIPQKNGVEYVSLLVLHFHTGFKVKVSNN